MTGNSIIHNGGRKMKIVFAIILSLISVTLATAQTNQTVAPTKIGFINSAAFEDKETGIKELVAAYEKLDKEFEPYLQELLTVWKEINKLHKELSAVGCYDLSGKSIEQLKEATNAKFNELEFLSNKYKKRENEARELYAKRESEVISPIRLKISKAIWQFAKENGYQIIFDNSKMEISFYNESFDVTKDFIEFYNKNSERY